MPNAKKPGINNYQIIISKKEEKKKRENIFGVLSKGTTCKCLISPPKACPEKDHWPSIKRNKMIFMDIRNYLSN